MKKTNCRLCKSDKLEMFLDLGHHPHSDNFRKDKDLPEVSYPLRLVQCQDCQFVQLDYTVSPDVLYDDDYLYESSITKTADKHWTEFVESVQKVVPNGRVLDIGSNDGTLLSKFKEKGFDVIGIDPCKPITDIANSRGIRTINALFDARNFIEYIGVRFNLITGSNVFAHIDDLDQVITDVKTLLAPNGVFVFESPYLGEFLKQLEYDTVYHQHLSYLAVAPLVKFLATHDMEIFNIEFTPIHGGCFRCYIARKGEREIQPIVTETANNEDFSLEVLKDFASKVEENRLKLLEIILDFKKQGRKIVAISTPAKGMTLLNYTGVGKYLDFTTDVSKLKQGRYTPGSQLLIKSDKDLVGDEIGVCLAWNFLDEIIANVPQIKTWVVPVPYPRIIQK
jgi:SAM-dependent methyltransferase